MAIESENVWSTYGKRRSFSDVNTMKISPEKPSVMRLLPRKKNAEQPVFAYSVHWIDQQAGNRFPIFHDMNKPCILCKHVQQLWMDVNQMKDEGFTDESPEVVKKKLLIQQMKGKATFDINVIDRKDTYNDDDEIQIKRWTFGNAIFIPLQELATDEDWGSPTHDENGYDVKVVATKQASFGSKYNITPATKTSTPLTKAEIEALEKRGYDLETVRKAEFTNADRVLEILLNAKVKEIRLLAQSTKTVDGDDEDETVVLAAKPAKRRVRTEEDEETVSSKKPLLTDEDDESDEVVVATKKKKTADDDEPVTPKKKPVIDEEEAPKRKKVVVEEDEDDIPVPPRKKKPVVEDDEPVTPKKKPAVTEDDEDEETPVPPRKKKPIVDDEDEPVAPKKKPVVTDDDDEPVTPKKKPVVDEDEDEAPKKVADDDDEDDKPEFDAFECKGLIDPKDSACKECEYTSECKELKKLAAEAEEMGIEVRENDLLKTKSQIEKLMAAASKKGKKKIDF